MTVIAWDGRSVAADSLCTFGGYRTPVPVRKIQRRGDLVFAISGFAAWFDAWIEWYGAGANPSEIPFCNLPAEKTGNFIVFKEGAALCCTPEMPHLMEIGAPDAWGCGCDFAIGAMKRGATAREAVAVAIDCSPQCGEPIIGMDLEPAAKAIRSAPKASRKSAEVVNRVAENGATRKKLDRK